MDNTDFTTIRIFKKLNDRLRRYSDILGLDKDVTQNQAIENWLREHQKEVNEKAKELL